MPALSRSLFRSLSRLLVLVMLATVFSPSFGWQAAQGMAVHGEGIAGNDSHGEHAAHAMLAAVPDNVVSGDLQIGNLQAGNCVDAGDCVDVQHHCCPGFFLGHLLGGTTAHVLPAIDAGRSVILTGRDARFSSCVPEGLERPPRASAA